jgi:leukotriene-A4 hydrolase
MTFKRIAVGGYLSTLFLVLLCACGGNKSDEWTGVLLPVEEDSTDPHTYSKPEIAVITHMDLDLDVDFKAKKLVGSVTYKIKHEKAPEIILDTRGLKIKQVMLGEQESETSFSISPEDSIKGSSLTIPLAPLTRVIKIYYETTEKSNALQWLSPQQTADKVHPFLYTQGQPILTRTWIPTQDSPGIRFTYDATIRTLPGLMAVMSAENPRQKSHDGVYTFKQVNPVPAYLIALASGDFQFAETGPRTGVYAELSLLQAAAAEFSDTDKMLNVAEKMYGTYNWGRYDLLVLPPSFPFGGMENPCLTFATPTILAGDKSLTTLVAHELAHSWSGNLVTNATWNDLWLNEGFTVYFERRIMEEVYGVDFTEMLNLLTYNNLKTLITKMGNDNPDTRLKMDLEGRNPDDGLTRIPYDKGFFLLKSLEQLAGRKTFDAFLSQYFKDHAYQTIQTGQFIIYAQEKLLNANKLEFDLNDWIYTTGLPADCPVPQSDRFEKVEKQTKAFVAKNDLKKLEAKEWSAQEWIHFIKILPRDLSADHMENLDRSFNLSNSRNAEIQAVWYELAIFNGYSSNIQESISDFLIKVGRRKYLSPLYTALKETDQYELARSIYAKARPNYHSISQQTLDQMLDF